MIQIKKSLQKYFGFEQGFYWNKVLEEFRQDITDAIVNNEMLAIIGAPGSGKNVLYDEAIKKIDENIIYVNVRNYYKERLDISSILNATIYDLCGKEETPRRDLEARSRQFIRIVGKKFVNDETLVSIVINEGHRIHANTYRALKELREATFAGKGPLFSVIITGHEDLLNKIESRKEVLWRCHALELNESNRYYKYDQRVAFINKVFGKSVNQTAAERLASITKHPLEIIYYIEKKMEDARKAGKKIIDEEVIKPSNAELKNALNLSYKQIADEAGIGKTTVVDILHNPAHPQNDAVQKAIARVHKKLTGKNILFGKAS